MWPRRSLRRPRFPVTGEYLFCRNTFSLCFGICLVCMRRNSVNSASGLKTAPPLCSATAISYKWTEIVAIWQHHKRVSGIFSLRRRRISYLGTSGQISDTAIRSATSISYKTDAFPLPSDVYRIYSMFLCYYVAWPCDVDLWPFDLESVSCTVLLMSDLHTNFIVLWLSVTELRLLSIWSHFRYLK